MAKDNEMILIKFFFPLFLVLLFSAPVFSCYPLVVAFEGKCAVGDWVKRAKEEWVCPDGFVLSSVGELGTGCPGVEASKIKEWDNPSEPPGIGQGVFSPACYPDHSEWMEAGAYERVVKECYHISVAPPSCVNNCEGNYQPTGPNCECECVISDDDVSDCEYVNSNNCTVNVKDAFLNNSYAIECDETGQARIHVFVKEYLWSPFIGDEEGMDGVFKCVDIGEYPLGTFDVYKVVDGGGEISFLVSTAFAYEEQFLCSLSYLSSMYCAVPNSWDWKYEIRPSEWWGRWESFFAYCEEPACSVEFDTSSLDILRDEVGRYFPFSLLFELVDFFDFSGGSDELRISLPYVQEIVIHFPDMAWFRGLLFIGLCVGIVNYFMRRFL